MSKKPSKGDLQRIREVLQREMAAGLTFDEAAKKAASSEPTSIRRIVELPDA